MGDFQVFRSLGARRKTREAKARGPRRRKKKTYHRRCDGGDEVCRLRTDPRRAVVEPPLDRAADLGQVRLGPAAKARHDRAEPVENDFGGGGVALLIAVVVALLLVRIESPVDQQLLEPGVDVGGALLPEDPPDRVHDQPAVGLGLVFEVLHDATQHTGPSDFPSDLYRGFQDTLVGTAVERHAADPEVLEESGQHLVADVRGRDAVGADALGDDLQDDTLHLIVGGRELAEEDDHDLFFFFLLK